MQTFNTADIVQRVSELRQEHRCLDARIEALSIAADPDLEFEIKRLKKHRLQLKDAIARLDSMLIPDQPA